MGHLSLDSNFKNHRRGGEAPPLPSYPEPRFFSSLLQVLLLLLECSHLLLARSAAVWADLSMFFCRSLLSIFGTGKIRPVQGVSVSRGESRWCSRRRSLSCIPSIHLTRCCHCCFHHHPFSRCYFLLAVAVWWSTVSRRKIYLF